MVRADLEVRDLPAAAHMLASVAAPFGGEVQQDRWDRYLALVLDALAAGAGAPPAPARPTAARRGRRAARTEPGAPS